MRLFIAIPIPEPIVEELKRAQHELKRATPSAEIRWSPPKHFHLTLKFLGEVAPDRVPDLQQAITGTCVGFNVMRLACARIGFFPGAMKPRVIWAGADDPQGRLARLAHALETAVQPFTSETKAESFVGHITLGRTVRIPRPAIDRLQKCAEGLSRKPFGTWQAMVVNLYQSELTPAGAVHTVISYHPLRLEE